MMMTRGMRLPLLVCFALACITTAQPWNDDAPGTRLARSTLEFRDALADPTVVQVLLNTSMVINETAWGSQTVNVTRNLTIRATSSLLAENRYAVIDYGTSVSQPVLWLLRRHTGSMYGGRRGGRRGGRSRARPHTFQAPLPPRHPYAAAHSQPPDAPQTYARTDTAGHAVLPGFRMRHDMDRNRREFIGIGAPGRGVGQGGGYLRRSNHMPACSHTQSCIVTHNRMIACPQSYSRQAVLGSTFRPLRQSPGSTLVFTKCLIHRYVGLTPDVSYLTSYAYALCTEKCAVW